MARLCKGRENEKPQYIGDLPEGNDGLGLMLLGVTGDQVLPADVYHKIKTDEHVKKNQAKNG